MARSTSHNSATWSTPFLDAGFNYFDTAWAYPGSEEATRKALVERYPRDAFLLATKAAPWFKCNNAQEAYAQLETSLERTGAGYIDYYLMHNLGSVRTEAFDRFDMWEFARAQARGGRHSPSRAFHPRQRRCARHRVERASRSRVRAAPGELSRLG